MWESRIGCFLLIGFIAKITPRQSRVGVASSAGDVKNILRTKEERCYQQDLYGLLIKSAADSIIKLAADPRYVGGRVGVMAVLHTWGSNLSYHPHVHCLVSAFNRYPSA